MKMTCLEAPVRTHPSSGQDTYSFQQYHQKVPACHSGAAFDGYHPVHSVGQQMAKMRFQPYEALTTYLWKTIQ